MELNTIFFTEQNTRSNFILKKKELAPFIYFKDINLELIHNVVCSNKTFVNRLDDESTLLGNETFQELVESIKEIGLLNPIYLLEDASSNYVIICGWRRFLALKELYKLNKNKTFIQKAIILKKETPVNLLEKISINENTKRKDLTTLELSYKFNKLAKTKGITINECLKEFNIGKTQFHAIRKAINFHPLIKENILESVGPIKANLLNKIFEKLLMLYPMSKAQTILVDYSEKTREELKNILKKLNENLNQSQNSFEIKKNNNVTILKIKENLTDEDHFKIEIFLKELLKK